MPAHQHTVITDWLSHLEGSPSLHISPRCPHAPLPSPCPSPASSLLVGSTLLGKRKHLLQDTETPPKRLRPARLTHKALREMIGSQGRRGGKSRATDGQHDENHPEVHAINRSMRMRTLLTPSCRNHLHLINHQLPPPSPRAIRRHPQRRHRPPPTNCRKRNYQEMFSP